MADTVFPHILALGPDSFAFRRVVAVLTASRYRVTVEGPPSDGTAAHQVPPPDLILLNYEWSPDTRSGEVLAMLGIESMISPIPIVVCCEGLGFARETLGSLATKGIDVVMHPVHEDVLLETVARRLNA